MRFPRRQWPHVHERNVIVKREATPAEILRLVEGKRVTVNDGLKPPIMGMIRYRRHIVRTVRDVNGVPAVKWRNRLRPIRATFRKYEGYRPYLERVTFARAQEDA